MNFEFLDIIGDILCCSKPFLLFFTMSAEVIAGYLINLSKCSKWNSVWTVDTTVLNWVTEESSDRFLTRLSGDFLKYLNLWGLFNRRGKLWNINRWNNSPNWRKWKAMHPKFLGFKTFLVEKTLSSDIQVSLLRVPPVLLDAYLCYYYSRQLVYFKTSHQTWTILRSKVSAL